MNAGRVVHAGEELLGDDRGQRAVQVEVVPLEHGAERRGEDHAVAPRRAGSRRAGGVGGLGSADEVDAAPGWVRAGDGWPRRRRRVAYGGHPCRRAAHRCGRLLCLAAAFRHRDRTSPTTSTSCSRSTAPSRPPEAFRRRPRQSATTRSIYARAAADPEAFWAEHGARARLDARRGTGSLDWKPPHAQVVRRRQAQRVASTASTGTSHGARRNKAALIWEGEPGDRRTLTYWELHREVSQFANVLKSLGVKKGDRVAIYMPMIPEAAIAMLACARIGAIHSVVFGGFSPEALRDRINDARVQGAHHRRRRLAARPGRAAQAQRRQGARGDARRSSTSSSCSAGPAPTATRRSPR